LQIEFEPAPGAGGATLPLIRSIPELSPCLIEGPNGIGKTLAVKLLALVCGQQPWLGDSKLWQSLRSSLGPVDVRVTGLQCGLPLEARLEPDGWPDDPPGEVGEWLGEVRLGGEPVSPRRVANVLTVERFAGNEDLEQVMRTDLGRQGAHLQLTAGVVDARVEGLLTSLGPLVELLAPAEPQHRERLLAELRELDGDVARLKKDLGAKRERQEAIAGALRMRGQLEHFAALPEALRSELKEQESRLVTLRKSRDDLEREIERLLADLRPKGELEEALATAQRRLNQRQRRLDRLQEQVVEVANRLGEKEAPEADAVRAKREAEQAAVEKLLGGLRLVDRGGRVQETIEDVLPALASARADGVGDEVIAELGGSALTIIDLEEGLIRREAKLRERPVADEAARLRAELAARQSRLRVLGELARLIRDAARAAELVGEAEGDVKAARAHMEKASEALRRYDDLVTRREETLAGISDALGSTVRLRSQLGLPSAESRDDLERDLDKLVAELVMAPDELDGAFGALDADVKSLETELNKAQHARDEAARRLRALDTELRRMHRRVRTDPELGYVSALLDAVDGAGDGTAPPVEALSRLSAAATAAERRVRMTRDVLGTLTRLVQVLASGERPGEESWLLDLDELLIAALGEQLRARLDRPHIRRALFGGHDLQELDLRERILKWRDEAGVVHRPLEAFSTGEQAFAFTQARILGLEELPEGQDRLLVLDEFGAFVDADRRDELAAFLATDEVKARASQVLVILPLQSNYEAELEETTGWLRQRYEGRLAQLRESGYIAEQFALGGHD
jgi:hypothetical protein